MFFSILDDQSATLVGKYEGRSQTDADYERCLEGFRSADACAVARGVPLVCVLIVPAGVRRPPPVWRTRMAETNNALRASEHRLALVMSDTLLRGVLTAITWLTRPRPGHQIKAFDTFANAAQWIRATTGKPYTELERLHAAIERETATFAATSHAEDHSARS